ncbi:MAG: type II toxin-antitoxin system RelE/ParE family toxin [Promethearchaeota archaeon]|nr:MAG: type II toxin-antitoxin system RelE/ParE family toxin [Candidatus Lokiarchaeota archaeon]
MEIRISEKAKRQLKNIYNYYSENSIQYAEHFLEDFYIKIESLKEFPKMYGIIPQLEQHNIRRLLFKDYRILYQVDENNELIKIVAILHSKQRLQL